MSQNLLGLPPPKPPIEDPGPHLLDSVDIKYAPLCVDLAHWLHEYTNCNIEVSQFWTALQNGCILCELMNNAQKKHSYNQKEIYKYIGYTLQQDLGDQLFYVRLNVETFVRWCKNFGCDTSLLCEVGDLVERKDLERSLSCIHAVARRLAELKLSYPKSVRLEVKYHMSYNQIIELFNEENTNLTPYQIGIKESFSELCEIIGLGKIDITKPLEANRDQWRNNLEGMWVGQRLENGE